MLAFQESYSNRNTLKLLKIAYKLTEMGLALSVQIDFIYQMVNVRQFQSSVSNGILKTEDAFNVMMVILSIIMTAFELENQ